MNPACDRRHLQKAGKRDARQAQGSCCLRRFSDGDTSIPDLLRADCSRSPERGRRSGGQTGDREFCEGFKSVNNAEGPSALRRGAVRIGPAPWNRRLRAMASATGKRRAVRPAAQSAGVEIRRAATAATSRVPAAKTIVQIGAWGKKCFITDPRTVATSSCGSTTKTLKRPM